MDIDDIECPCCGLEREPGIYGFTAACPICGWQADADVGETEPSALNDGLSLYEAKLNFHTFGSIHFPLPD